MPTPKSGTIKPPRVGTCPICRLAVYADDVIAEGEHSLHSHCSEAQKREIAEWNETVRKDREGKG